MTEGIVTERQYVEAFARSCHNSRVSVEVVGAGAAPLTVVQTAKNRIKEAKRDAKGQKDKNLLYEEVWCVFDCDAPQNLNQAIQMAVDCGVKLALSNPCFELWLLLHFANPPGAQNSQHVANRLKTHVPGYNKHIEFRDYVDGYEQAKKHAEGLERRAMQDSEPHRNPTTGVWRLTELIKREA